MCEKPNQRLKISDSVDSSSESGILNERILVLVFECLKWDIRVLCVTASVNRRLRGLAKRVLWRGFCLYRAPRMVYTLTGGVPNSRIIGGWHPLAKLLFFCGGCVSSPNFEVIQPSSGHFAKSSRFSKTSGLSFLSKKCRGDVLYVSDPCEHPTTRGEQDDVGMYRGVFRDFGKSRTRDLLIRRRVDLEAGLRCPYCAMRVWSMTAARLIQRKSVARRLGSNEGGVEYFVCLNGHLHGSCWLVPLTSGEENTEDDPETGDDDEEDSINFSATI
ncbi:EID1-like F-box protein 3 [Henckelia pumila]|uniref:EID1-like F-box protein 3 n=1 Tax=Henckelia pumila TaxID=405737 RepID=UPI003C6E5B95